MQVKAAKLDKEKSEPPLRSSTMKLIQAGARKTAGSSGDRAFAACSAVEHWARIGTGLHRTFLTNKAVRIRRGSAACGWTKSLQKSKSWSLQTCG